MYNLRVEYRAAASSFGFISAVAILAAALSSCGGGGAGASFPKGGLTVTGPTTKAQLGQAIFFDPTLSNPPGESCATCHAPTRAFTDPRPGPTSPGAVAGLFGFRHAPSICYMAYSPAFQLGVGGAGGAIGGQFWDGRARDLPTQATFPIVNPIEMGNASIAAYVAKVQASASAAGLKAIYGSSVFSSVGTAMNAITDAVATYERTPMVSPFSSKYDAFLAGKAQLTQPELNGLALFNGKGGCAGCHTSSPLPDGTPPLFTNFCYANLGLPRNPNNPYYTIPKKYNPLGAAFLDNGLGTTTGRAADAGNFMTQSLRNAAIIGPYFHNGIFTTLKQVVHFYNTRDLGGFGPPEVPSTEDTTELGNLHLTDAEEDEIVSFLCTLTDGFTAPSGRVPPQTTPASLDNRRPH
jgi:cytochrome c peroxidase